MGFPFLYLVPFTDKAELTHAPVLMNEVSLRSIKHSNKIEVCQVAVAMMNTFKEVSRGAQISGLVRKTTVKTGQNQAQCWGHRPMRQSSGGYLHSSHCLLHSGWRCP